MRADIFWLLGVVFLRCVGSYASGLLIPEEVVYMDWGMLSIWFSWLAALDLICVTLLLGAAGAKFLTVVMYFSCVWSVILALESALGSDYLSQIDRYIQYAILLGILAALAWGVKLCRESRSRSSSLRQ